MRGARYPPKGALDTGFNDVGTRSSLIGKTSVESSAALEPDGKIVLAGQCGEGGDVVVLRIRHQRERRLPGQTVARRGSRRAAGA